MPKLPRDLTQEQAIRALIRCGGAAVPRQGKGSHRKVIMPNCYTAVFPYGRLRLGLLAAALKGAELSVEDFLDAL